MADGVLRYSAFPDAPGGGNPAGVVLDAVGLDDGAMLRIAADVGYSETAFLRPRTEPATHDVRFFAPDAEVPFCGHATIATAVALAARDGAGPITLHCAAGVIEVETISRPEGVLATLTSVPPRARLARLDYAFEELRALCLEHDLVTLALIWRENELRFHARNPFPIGGVVEDPATGAAAAALGGYLRALGAIGSDASFTVLQGADMGRPSRLTVTLECAAPGIRVSGTAVLLGD